MQKDAEFFRIFLKIHDFFDFFVVFSYKTFLYSELQLRALYQKIPHKILHRTVNIRS